MRLARASGGSCHAPSRGSSTHSRSGWRMRPACSPASGPKPQKKSARTEPLIAPPVSWAAINCCSGSAEPGRVLSMNTGTPSGTTEGSTAMLRRAVSATPSEPNGPSPLGGSSRKNT